MIESIATRSNAFEFGKNARKHCEHTHKSMYQHKNPALNQTQVGHIVKDCSWHPAYQHSCLSAFSAHADTRFQS